MKWLVLLCVVLAGCSDPSSTSKVEVDETPVPTATTGVIDGVVVDDSITPIAGAKVTLVNTGEEITSGDDGGFSFGPLEPGTYLVEAVKLGYERISVDAVVVAGEPQTIRVQLPSRPGFDPYVTPMQWDGLLVCSWNVNNFFLTGCGLEDQLEDRSRQYDMVNPRGQWLQTELVWEHSQPLGENLCMRHYASSGYGGDILGDTCGPTNLLFAMDAAAIETNGVGNTRGVERIVWVDHWSPDTAGIAIDQPFTAFTHVFHNFVPEDGWLFTVDGNHPVP